MKLKILSETPKVLLPLAKGFEDLEAVSIIDILRRGGVKVTTAAIGSSREVLSAHGVLMTADELFTEAAQSDYDMIVLPGGGEGTENLKNSDELIVRLQRQQQEGRWLAAICAAPTVLVEAGVVEPGLRMKCYTTCQMELDRPWNPAPVVVNGNVITGQAPGSALLFALVLLKTLAGDATAQKVARGMVTDVFA